MRLPRVAGGRVSAARGRRPRVALAALDGSMLSA